MYYFSNNYSKYIEALKLEKSKIAFKQLVENSREDKSSKIIVENETQSKDSSNITFEGEIPSKDGDPIRFEGEIPSKDGKRFIYEGDTVTKEGINFSLESNETGSKSSNNIKNDVIADSKIGSGISVDGEFDEKSPIETDFDRTFESKNNSYISEENTASSKTENRISNEDSVSGKQINNINPENAASKKIDSSIAADDIISVKEENDINKRYDLDKKDYSDISKDYGISSKNKIELDNERDIAKKLNHLIDDRYAFSSKSTSDIIKSIKLEKKRDGEFANVIFQPKKQEVSRLNTIYTEHIINPKKLEEMEYERNAKTYKYYPAGSYAQIDATQTYAINDVVGTISNESNWDPFNGKEIVSSLKVASDIIDMINLVGPSKNIYVSGKTQNDLRMDLRIGVENEAGQKNLLKDEKEESRDLNYIDDGEGSYKPANAPSLKPSYEKTQKEETKEYDKEKEKKSLKEEFLEKRFRDLNYIDDGVGSYRPADVPEKKNEEEKKFSYSYYDRSGKYISYKDDEKIDNIADVLKLDEGRWYDNENAIGKIYVIPPDAELANTVRDPMKNVPFLIPLQNNLTFEQMSRPATWNAINFFGRIGDVQQYSKTGNLDMITVTTKYFIDNNSDDGSGYNMSRLQEIEMMYRSLVLPATESSLYIYSSESEDSKEKNEYHYFTRPPIINIVLGNPNFTSSASYLEDSEAISNREVYHNLFTELYTVPREGGGFDNNLYYKNFVVTNVTIDKNLNDYNYYIGNSKVNSNGDRNYYDTTGFTVMLSIMEIDENYLGSLPSFNNYEYTLKSRRSI